ncbi:MAG: hypothetical protein IPO18_03555 [bacterium]|nr:hypothetical protein [bacterium]
MRKMGWDRSARIVALVLVGLSLLLPLYRLNSLGAPTAVNVFAWEAVSADAAFILVFAAPALVAVGLARAPGRKLGSVVLAVAPLALLYSAMVVVVVSGMAAVGAPFWRPAQSALGVGCWALVLADLLLLAAWGRSAFRGLRGQPRVAI